ncbi:MAG: SIS domain-containing protein [Bacteroidia bacterium]
MIASIIEKSIEVKTKILNDLELLQKIQRVGQVMAAAFEQDKKVLFCGNGGSAADAQHLAAELSGRFYKDRKPLFAEALHVNTSYLTAVGNDYGFEYIYARMIEAAGRQGDILVSISTSGNSPNILKAIEKARNQGMLIIGMTGENGGKMAMLCDFLINVPSGDTPRIQESHIMIGHIWCEQVERILF